MSDNPTWILYLLECEDGSYYAGITISLERRFTEHLAGVGAKYTRSHPPQRVLAVLACANRSEASVAEAAVKRMPKAAKLDFFRNRGGEVVLG